MPKPTRPLGVDRPVHSEVFQGVPVKDTFPKPNLGVSLDDILLSQQPGTGVEQLDHPLPSSPAAVQPAAVKAVSTLLDLPVDQIDLSPHQPRLKLSDEDQEKNTTAIAVAGRVNRPILVRPLESGRYELIGGATRLNSVLTLGWPTIPAQVVDVDDAEAEILAVSDNEGQTDLSDFEKGRAYARILERGKVKSTRALAERVGSSPATVSRCLAFMKLPSKCITYLELNPGLLGSTLISEFVEISRDFPELTLQALEKIDQEAIPQEVALRWLKSSAATAAGKEKPLTSVVSTFDLGSKGEAKLVRRKDSINLKLPKGMDMAAVEAAIKSAMIAFTSAD